MEPGKFIPSKKKFRFFLLTSAKNEVFLPFYPQKCFNWPKNWSYSVFRWFLWIPKFSAKNVKNWPIFGQKTSFFADVSKKNRKFFFDGMNFPGSNFYRNDLIFGMHQIWYVYNKITRHFFDFCFFRDFIGFKSKKIDIFHDF